MFVQTLRENSAFYLWRHLFEQEFNKSIKEAIFRFQKLFIRNIVHINKFELLLLYLAIVLET